MVKNDVTLLNHCTRECMSANLSRTERFTVNFFVVYHNVVIINRASPLLLHIGPTLLTLTVLMLFKSLHMPVLL